jgi:hypothetical protein
VQGGVQSTISQAHCGGLAFREIAQGGTLLTQNRGHEEAHAVHHANVAEVHERDEPHSPIWFCQQSGCRHTGLRTFEVLQVFPADLLRLNVTFVVFELLHAQHPFLLSQEFSSIWEVDREEQGRHGTQNCNKPFHLSFGE